MSQLYAALFLIKNKCDLLHVITWSVPHKAEWDVQHKQAWSGCHTRCCFRKKVQRSLISFQSCMYLGICDQSIYRYINALYAFPCSHKLADGKTRKIMGRDEFRLLHYAGEVNYNVNGVCVHEYVCPQTNKHSSNTSVASCPQML